MKVAAIALALGGCFTQLTAGTTVARGQVTGAGAEIAIGDSGVRATAALVGQDVARDRGDTVAVHLDEGLRVSVPGIVYYNHDPDWIQWLDFGGDVGAGVGVVSTDPLARAWVGGWADLRVLPRHDRYPTLRAQLRRVAYTSGVDNETEMFFGIGWTARDPSWQPRFH
jgi:hypothetical protein